MNQLHSNDMITVDEALPNELNIIQDIARRTWPVTYGNILSNSQLLYMLDLFYSTETLNDNIVKGHQFLILRKGNVPVGFASFELGYKTSNNTHIHKIYVLPEMQGTGAGKALMTAIELNAKSNHFDTLTLNVNRSNEAQGFYEKIGFNILEEVDIKLDHGYLMEDYVMRKDIVN